MISAIVLAAGSSNRMEGSNKLLLPYKGSTIIEYVVSQVRQAAIEEIILVTGFENDKIQKLFNGKKVTCIHNPEHLSGMTSSIQKGVSIAKGKGYMICLADMVTLQSADYQVLQQKFNESYKLYPQSILTPVYNGVKGNPVVFSSYYKNIIHENTFPEGCKKIIEQHSENVIRIEMSTDHILHDIDFKKDYDDVIKKSSD